MGVILFDYEARFEYGAINHIVGNPRREFQRQCWEQEQNWNSKNLKRLYSTEGHHMSTVPDKSSTENRKRSLEFWLDYWLCWERKPTWNIEEETYKKGQESSPDAILTPEKPVVLRPRRKVKQHNTKKQTKRYGCVRVQKFGILHPRNNCCRCL